MTDMLQKSENVAKNVANENSQDLTNYDILKEYEAHQTPVPSYDELQNMNEAVNQAMSANIKLVEQNAQLKELLKEWAQFETEENPNDFTVMSERMSGLANKTKEALQ